MKILWVKSGTLFPPDTGGRRRTLAMLREITRAGHTLHYLGLKPDSHPITPEEQTDPYAQTKEWVTSHEPAHSSPRFFLHLLKNLLLSRQPYVLDRYRSAAWRQRIIESAAHADLVICDFLTPAPHFENLALGKPTYLFQHNIEAQIWKRLADSAKTPLKRAYLRSQHHRMARAEKHLSTLFDGVITVSPDDTTYCREHYHLTNVLGHVPTGVDITSFRPAPHPPAIPTIGFLGSMDWMPNIEGIHWFLREVLPLVRHSLPTVRLKIIGRNPPATLRDLPLTDPAIEVTGTVPDVQPHVHDCTLIAVPLLAGGGTRIKIFEAMAMGVPVVSTTIGAEGLPLTPGTDLQIADSPPAFAKSLLALLTDPALTATLATHARHRMETDFTWAAAATRFIKLATHTE
jgi:glycosyltransferase involved in cell wall biosynthesis